MVFMMFPRSAEQKTPRQQKMYNAICETAYFLNGNLLFKKKAL